MADIVNLRRERKRKAREADERLAEANRVLFGRSRAERAETCMAKSRETRFLDAHRRDGPNPSGEEADR